MVTAVDKADAMLTLSSALYYRESFTNLYLLHAEASRKLPQPKRFRADIC